VPEGIVQALHHDVQLPTWSCPTVSDRLLLSSFKRCTTATSSFHQPTTTRCTTLLVQFICPAGLFCGWSVGVELTARRHERGARQQEHLETTSRRLCLHRTDARRPLNTGIVFKKNKIVDKIFCNCI